MLGNKSRTILAFIVCGAALIGASQPASATLSVEQVIKLLGEEFSGSPAPVKAHKPGPISVQAAPGTPKLPELNTASFVLADAETGEILAARDPHVQRRPASTLKTLTTLALLPRLNQNSVYTATQRDYYAEGGRVGIVPGGKYTVRDLFHGLLMMSGNDAAASLAHSYGGWEPTLKAMNEELDRINAVDTNAVNPSGLDQEGQLSSAYDLAQMIRAAIQMPLFREIAQTRTYDFPMGPTMGSGSNKGRAQAGTFGIYNQDRLLSGFEGIIAGKTGYTTQAGRTFVAAAQRGGRTYVIALMGIGGNTEATAESLLTYAFKHGDTLAAVDTLPAIDPAPEREPADVAERSVTRAAAAIRTEPEVAPTVADRQRGSVPAAGTDVAGDSPVPQSAGVETPASDNGGGLWGTLVWTMVLLGLAIAALRARAVIRRRRRRATLVAGQSIENALEVDLRDRDDTRVY